MSIKVCVAGGAGTEPYVAGTLLATQKVMVSPGIINGFPTLILVDPSS